MRTLRVWESSVMLRWEGTVKVQAACWGELLQPFEHKVDSWKETLFGKHSSLGSCSEVQHALAQAVRRARKHAVGRAR